MCNANYGVTFGGGFDIYVANNLSGIQCYSDCSTYGKNEGITDKHYLTGNSKNNLKFQPTEVEVYQLCYN
jgi:hypothetical protein